MIGNNLAHIVVGTFAGLSKQKLILDGNNIHTVDNGAFANSTDLNFLQLTIDNQLQSLPADVFRGLKKLQYLNLSGNRIT